MTVPHQSEAPVCGRTGFSKIGGLLASVPSVSCPNFRAASLQKIGSKLFCRTGTLATQATAPKNRVDLFIDRLPWEIQHAHHCKSQSKQSYLSLKGNMGRFPFTKKFRKFRLGCKWHTRFWFVQLEIFRNKRNF